MSETEAATGVAVAFVPVVIISNILDRVPDLVSLFRCSLVCKEWRSLVADPAFLRRHGIWPERDSGQSQLQSSASLIGILVQHDRQRNNTASIAPPALVPVPGSALGPHSRFLTSFVRAAGSDSILDGASPLAARDGVILVRIWPCSTDSSAMIRLCVCNLLTGSCDILPALDVNEAFIDGGVYGYALLTAADHRASDQQDDKGRRLAPIDGYTTLFQVLLIGRSHDGGHPQVHKFSSASGGWDGLDCSQTIYGAREPELWGPYACCVGAVAGGMAHWLFCGGDAHRFYTLDVSAGTGQVSMTALPADAVAAITRAVGQHTEAWWLCTMPEERLALLCMKGNNRLVTMKQRGDGDRWDTGHVVQVDVDVEVELGFGDESLSPVCIGERSGTTLVLYHSDPMCAYVLDLASGSATEVEGWSRSFNYMTTVFCEINWEMFFLSRLGVKLI